MNDTSPAGLQRAILGIALPSMLTNVATALFGLADMWVIGRLGDAAAQGGVEVGAKLLMTLLIVFNFLRSGTTALTAQAAGRGDDAAQAATLARSLAVAAGIGALLLAAWPLITPVLLKVLGASDEVARQARTYVDIRYAGGLAWLANAALTGWLIGRRRVREVLAVEVGSNLFHVALDLALVLGLGLGVAGVATATLCSEGAKLLALAFVTAREGPARALPRLFRDRVTWRAAEVGALLRLNRDLFGRTLLLMGATVLLTRAGAQQGAVVLAANAILYQLFILGALILDGFESSAQVLCAEALGARDRQRFIWLIRTIMAWAFGAAAAIAAAYWVWGRDLAASFSADRAVVATTGAYIAWAVALPVLGVASFVLDGVFIGSGWTRAMLLTMAAALVVFLSALALGAGYGNHGLWAAFCLFFVARATGQAIALPRLVRHNFG